VRITRLILLAAACFTWAGPLPAAADDKPARAAAELSRGRYPATLASVRPDLARFNNQHYFRAFATDDVLRTAEPVAVWARLKSAADAGKNHKALLLARLFTQMQPESAAGWKNRSALAATLGLAEEAALSQANAEHPAQRVPVPGGFLPGRAFRVRPATLDDWAAAVVLLGDDVWQATGGQALVAIRDDVSGVEVITPDGATDGGYVVAKRLRLHDVGQNLFATRRSQPMKQKSSSAGWTAAMLGATMMSALNQSSGNTALANDWQDLANRFGGRAAVAPSRLEGGSFEQTTWAADTGRAVTETVKPRPAGEFKAVSTPLVVLWASGPSGSASVRADGVTGKGKRPKVQTWAGPGAGAAPKTAEAPSLWYPRLGALSLDGVSYESLTILELMLTAEDLEGLVPDAQARPSRHAGVPAFEQAYERNAEIYFAPATQVEFLGAVTRLHYFGFEGSGAVYRVTHQPTEWLAPAASAK
jgi:hypothetical protein